MHRRKLVGVGMRVLLPYGTGAVEVLPRNLEVPDLDLLHLTLLTMIAMIAQITQITQITQIILLLGSERCGKLGVGIDGPRANRSSGRARLLGRLVVLFVLHVLVHVRIQVGAEHIRVVLCLVEEDGAVSRIG